MEQYSEEDDGEYKNLTVERLKEKIDELEMLDDEVEETAVTAA